VSSAAAALRFLYGAIVVVFVLLGVGTTSPGLAAAILAFLILGLPFAARWA
jgi:hypothetical protein